MQAVACFFPPVDFLTWSRLGEDAVAYGARHGFSRPLARAGTPGVDIKKIEFSVSPINYVASTMTPTLIIPGDRDEIVPVFQTRKFEQTCRLVWRNSLRQNHHPSFQRDRQKKVDVGQQKGQKYLMRTARIKVDAGAEEGLYHCMSRTVNGEFLLKEADREAFRRQMWKVAEYCGVQVLTYTILSNHFHIVVRVPVRGPVSDEELLRRYAVLYPRPTRYQTARLEVIKAQLESGGPDAVQWRRRQLRQMGDVSEYMKLLKMRFSIWYNHRHKRYGTLWSERFKSMLVEEGKALRTMAPYVDLNCVRALLAEDPKDYRFCGYAEAVAGNEAARKGIAWLMGVPWAEASASYRQILFGTGANPMHVGGRISEEQLAEVVRQKGKLPLAAVLRCRIRYFSEGAVLGSSAFVARHLGEHQRRYGRVRGLEPKPMMPVTDWEHLTTMRTCRSMPIV